MRPSACAAQSEGTVVSASSSAGSPNRRPHAHKATVPRERRAEEREPGRLRERRQRAEAQRLHAGVQQRCPAEAGRDHDAEGRHARADVEPRGVGARSVPKAATASARHSSTP